MVKDFKLPSTGQFDGSAKSIAVVLIISMAFSFATIYMTVEGKYKKNMLRPADQTAVSEDDSFGNSSQIQVQFRILENPALQEQAHIQEQKPETKNGFISFIERIIKLLGF